jgi:hypothetical protein
MTGRKYEPPLYLDMDFDVALERFGKTDPKEVKDLMEREKRKKKAGKERGPPGSRVDRKDEGD